MLAKPIPRIDETSRPFWDACNKERLRIQRCADCRDFNYYPRVCCPSCRSGTLEWVDVSGSGRIVTHTTIYRTHHDSFNAEAPYVFAAVRLDEGPIIYAQILGAPAEASLVGRTVRAVFETLTPHQKILSFKLV